MGEVLKLGITKNNNQPIKEVKSIEVLTNKGIVGDRHFHEFNDPYNQLSLIESENIDEYNARFGHDIPYVDFRRNVITKGIRLNDLIGTKCQDIAVIFGTLGGVAAGTVIQATLGNHNGFQYIITIDECSESISSCQVNQDKAFVQGDKESISKGQRVVIIYGNDIRVIPYEG